MEPLPAEGPRFAYVGCYTTPDRDGRGRGIGVYQIDAAGGAWREVETLEAPNPSFLAVHPGGRWLYCVHGGNDFSQVSAFAIDGTSGRLTPLNREACGGANPVHLSFDASGRWLVVANYAAGTVGLLPVAAAGRLEPLADLVTLSGPPGPDPVEQASAHPHHCPFDPAGRVVVVPDKGLDRVFTFRLDAPRGRLLLGEPPYYTAQPGAGPRHAACHPRLPRAYVLNELDSTITVCAFDAATAALRPLTVVPTLPPNFAGRSTGAEIALDPAGRYLYASNRGHDSLASFAVDPADGSLSPLDWEPTGGRTPRFFTLDPAGRRLYAANQASDTIVPFQIEPESGRLRRLAWIVQTGSPACIVFA